ncbi:hypothetical protein GCM10011578_014660 [Streptomyces fuscichromogenes]|uniref:Uncharacterized protein n=2 Tax=Streptomyces fuscichromogenes TaxID=1324013 RepID=A0A917UIU0_9ACTN|nr:hypothetical protein GCM10011578_014660 [Streptomyces fuscichromogenes]
MRWFTYAVGGEIIVDFHTLHPLGLVPGQVAPLHGVLALVESAGEIRLRRPDDVDDERWSGRLLPLPAPPLP